MQTRKTLIRQAAFTFCLWAILAVEFWPRLIESRTEISKSGLATLSRGSLFWLVVLAILEVLLLAISIQRLFLALRAPLNTGEH